MEKQVKEANTPYNEKKSILEKWVAEQPHFEVSEVTDKVDGILVSFRTGKRVTTPARRAIYQGGKRTVVQTGIQVPRGALTEETVYGKLGDKFVVKYPLDHPSMKPENIVDPTIRALVQKRVTERSKDAFKEPLYSAEGMMIKSVRCYTSLQNNSMVTIKYDDNNRAIGFAKKGNNHHIAIYQDTNGEYHEMVVSFWDAVERKRKGLPVIIESPQEDWHLVLSMQENEMFVLGMEDDEFNDAIEKQDYAALNKHLYRVQKLTSRDYWFRFHTETSVDDKFIIGEETKTNVAWSANIGKVSRVQSFGGLFAKFPHKVKIDIMGRITKA